MDAINKDMDNFLIEFMILEPVKPKPVGGHKASGHIVFDVNINFTRKEI